MAVLLCGISIVMRDILSLRTHIVCLWGRKQSLFYVESSILFVLIFIE